MYVLCCVLSCTIKKTYSSVGFFTRQGEIILSLSLSCQEFIKEVEKEKRNTWKNITSIELSVFSPISSQICHTFLFFFPVTHTFFPTRKSFISYLNQSKEFSYLLDRLLFIEIPQVSFLTHQRTRILHLLHSHTKDKR